MIIDIAMRNLISIDSNDVIILTDTETRKIIDHNNALLNIFNHPVIGKTLSELTDASTSHLTGAELRYCDYVESTCIESKKCAISLEQFKASMHLCVRLLITSANGEVMILTIIKHLDIKELLPNQVYFI